MMNTLHSINNQTTLENLLSRFIKYLPNSKFMKLAFLYTVFTIPDIFINNTISSNAETNENIEKMFNETVLQILEKVSLPIVFLVAEAAAQRNEHKVNGYLKSAFVLNLIIGVAVFFILKKLIRDNGKCLESEAAIDLDNNMLLTALLMLIRKGLITTYLAIEEIKIEKLLWFVLAGTIPRYLCYLAYKKETILGNALALSILSVPFFLKLKPSTLTKTSFWRELIINNWITPLITVIGLGISSSQSFGISFVQFYFSDFYLCKNSFEAGKILAERQTILSSSNIIATLSLLNGTIVAIEVYITKLRERHRNDTSNNYQKFAQRLIPLMLPYVICMTVIMGLNYPTINDDSNYFAYCDNGKNNAAYIMSGINIGLMLVNELCLSIIFAESKKYRLTFGFLFGATSLFVLALAISIKFAYDRVNGSNEMCLPLYSAASELGLNLLQLVLSCFVIKKLRNYYKKPSTSEIEAVVPNQPATAMIIVSDTGITNSERHPLLNSSNSESKISIDSTIELDLT